MKVAAMFIVVFGLIFSGLIWVINSTPPVHDLEAESCHKSCLPYKATLYRGDCYCSNNAKVVK